MGRGRMGGSGSRGSSGSSVGRSGSGRVHHRTTIFVGGRHHGEGGSPWIGIIVGLIFAVVGLSVSVMGVTNIFKYGTVSATVVANEQKGAYYYTTYNYTVDDKNYTNRSMQSWEFEEDKDVVTIYYLKSDPNKIYEEAPTTKGEAAIMIVFGLIFAGGGAAAFLVCFKEIKNKINKSSKGESDIEKSTSREESTRTCAYCGTKYNKNSSSCPKCGAGK